MKVLFIGDIVGKSGRNALFERLPFLRQKYDYDLLIVNGENSAHGKGITRKIYDSFINAGVDCVTLGNHAFSKDNVLGFINDEPRLIRPANMDPRHIGKPVWRKQINGLTVGVYNIYGTIFMENANGNAIYTMEELLRQYPSDIRIVDIHAEATSEKYAFMRYFSDCVQMVVGTHTHIQTADEAIYDRCAFICDVGMTGPYDSILGRDTGEVLTMFTTGEMTRYTVSESPPILCGVFAEIDESSRRAVSIERIRLLPDVENC